MVLELVMSTCSSIMRHETVVECMLKTLDGIRMPCVGGKRAFDRDHE